MNRYEILKEIKEHMINGDSFKITMPSGVYEVEYLFESDLFESGVADMGAKKLNLIKSYYLITTDKSREFELEEDELIHSYYLANIKIKITRGIMFSVGHEQKFIEINKHYKIKTKDIIFKNAFIQDIENENLTINSGSTIKLRFEDIISIEPIENIEFKLHWG